LSLVEKTELVTGKEDEGSHSRTVAVAIATAAEEFQRVVREEPMGAEIVETIREVDRK
jgi:hypothetical protein